MTPRQCAGSDGSGSSAPSVSSSRMRPASTNCMTAAEVNCFVGVLRETSYTGESGDGRIFVMNVERAVNIRTGDEGEKAL